MYEGGTIFSLHIVIRVKYRFRFDAVGLFSNLDCCATVSIYLDRGIFKLIFVFKMENLTECTQQCIWFRSQQSALVLLTVEWSKIL